MGTRRLGLALAAALIISIGVTSLFYLRITHAQASSKPETRRVIAAAAALQTGIPITADNLTEINWPATASLDGLIEKKEDAIGRVPMYAIDAKEPVLKHSLAPNGSLGLAAKIPDGMRATSVKTNEVQNIAGFIFPGSHVDVLVTLRGDGNQAASTTTRTVLQNVQVLASGTRTDPDPTGKPENVNVVTLLVTPAESEKLALAQSQVAQNQGSIHFVLRNGGDAARPDTAPIDMAELAGLQKKPPATVVGRGRKIPAAKAPDAYTVETVAGGKTTVAKFPVILE
jgi:pilus assembly protein CpaB